MRKGIDTHEDVDGLWGSISNRTRVNYRYKDAYKGRTGPTLPLAVKSNEPCNILSSDIFGNNCVLTGEQEYREEPLLL